MYSENYTDIHKVVMSKENCCRFKYRPLKSNCECFDEKMVIILDKLNVGVIVIEFSFFFLSLTNYIIHQYLIIL